MKPWKICAAKQKSYKIDIRDLISTYDLPPVITKFHLNYDFVNKKFLDIRFKCRYNDENGNDFNNGTKM